MGKSIEQLTLFEDDGKFPYDKTIEQNINPINLVTQSNSLIETPQDLSLQEKRIILTLASLISPDDEDFKKHYIRVKDLAEIIGIENKNFYDEVKKTITGLQGKQLKIVRDEDNQQTEEYINWLGYSKYFNGHGMVGLAFWPDMKDYLLELSREFTSIRLRYLLRLKSEYSIRIYEILKRYEGLGNQYFPLERLRFLLNIEPGKYEKYGHIKSKILLKAQKELAEKTDLHFEFEEKKNGRTVVGVHFFIKTTKKTVSEVIEKDEITKGNSIAVLIDMGIRYETAKQLLAEFGEEQVLKNLEYVFNTKSEDKIENIAGYVIAAIKGNYVASTTLPTPKKRQKSSKESDESVFKKQAVEAEKRKAQRTAPPANIDTIEMLNKKIETEFIFLEIKLKTKVINKSAFEQSLYDAISSKISSYQSHATTKGDPPLTVEDLQLDEAKKVYKKMTT